MESMDFIIGISYKSWSINQGFQTKCIIKSTICGSKVVQLSEVPLYTELSKHNP